MRLADMEQKKGDGGGSQDQMLEEWPYFNGKGKVKEGVRETGFPGGSDGKGSACNAGDLGLIPRLGRSPGGGHGNPLQHSCLENPMDRGAWRAAVPGVTESQTQQRVCSGREAQASLVSEQRSISPPDPSLLSQYFYNRFSFSGTTVLRRELTREYIHIKAKKDDDLPCKQSTFFIVSLL